MAYNHAEKKFRNLHGSSNNKKGILREILTFCFVYLVCTIGNLILSLILGEGLMPFIDSNLNAIFSGDPTEFQSNVLSSPYISIITLFSTAATSIIVVAFCKFIQKKSWASIGFSMDHAFPHYVRGIAFGAITISIAVVVCIVTGAAYFNDQKAPHASLIPLFLLAYLIQGSSEEILCRGYFMNSIAENHSVWLAVVVNSVFFSLLHILNSGVSTIAFFNLFLFGVLASLVTIRTGSIWYACGFHSAWNFVQGNIFGVKVSGADMNASLFYFVPDPLKTYLNGGDFGIEGSFLCTLIFALSILVLLPRQHQANKSFSK